MENEKHPKPKKIKSEWPKIFLTKNERKDLRKAFRMFDQKGLGIVSFDIVKISLRVLGYDISREDYDRAKSDYGEITDDECFISLRNYELCMEQFMLIKDKRIDNEKSFELMVICGTGAEYTSDSTIDADILRQVANYIGEDITDEEIEQMIELVSGSKTGKVDLNSFMKIMRMVKPPRPDQL